MSSSQISRVFDVVPQDDVRTNDTHDDLHNVVYCDQSGLPLATKNGRPVFPRPIRRKTAQYIVKRGVDIAASLVLLAITSPIMVMAAAAVAATSKGPVLFSQPREGYGRKPITIHKFRTLYADLSDTDGTLQVVAGDSRITPVGRFLRRTSIDELPQLFNVLIGDMSLVGPRPHPFNMLAGGRLYEDLVPYYRLRCLAKPGLTGWAQANGLRGPTTDPAVARARVDHDIAYIQNFSLWLDIKALWLTGTREIWRMAGS